MMIHPDRMLLLVTAALLTLTGCAGAGGSDAAARPTPSPATDAGTAPEATVSEDAVSEGTDGFPRTFRHTSALLGQEYYAHLPDEVEIPARPERIVSLSPGEHTDGLLSLGITPVGSGSYTPGTGPTDDPSAWPPAVYDAAVAAGVPAVGLGWEPDLEMIASLEPDLIVGTGGSPEVDGVLQQLAPQVEPFGSRDWRETFRALAFAVGAEDRAEEVIATWEERAADLRQRLEGATIALLRPRPDVVWVYGPPSNAGTILAEVGVELLEGPEGSSITDDAPGAIGEISMEEISALADADHLFVMSYSVDEDQLDAFLDQPLWQELPAVRAGDVTLVEGTAWTNHGPLGADVVLDELESGLEG